ncbi:MAG: NAD-dependent epimerase/dehydratase family protein [Elusimicrobia bacterium]|nr:NAD-dependent epimerase/dehydratase family protein [Elusimicrobiota bacterium]
MKSFVVTGGAGFIGSCLARRLVAGGGRVLVLDDLSAGFKRNVPSGALFRKVDLSDDRALARVRPPAKLDAVFHLAAQSSGEASFDDPRRDVAVNHLATYNLLDWSARHRCRRFVFASSMSVYGDVPAGSGRVAEGRPPAPASFYGCNKLASEATIRAFSRHAGLGCTILRLFNVYGPGQNMLNMKQGMVSIYMSYLMNGLPIRVKGSLGRSRDFVYVEDVVDAFLRGAASPRAAGRTYNVGTGVRTSVRALLRELLGAYGLRDWRRWVEVAGRTSGDVSGFASDPSSIRRELGWRPRWPLSRGIPQMKLWCDETRAIWKGGR